MKVRKVPMRTCVVTHEKLEKKELLRVVRDNEANGRGAYIKKDRETIEKARKSKILERHLEVTIKDEIYDELLTKI